MIFFNSMKYLIISDYTALLSETKYDIERISF